MTNLELLAWAEEKTILYDAELPKKIELAKILATCLQTKTLDAIHDLLARAAEE